MLLHVPGQILLWRGESPAGAHQYEGQGDVRYLYGLPTPRSWQPLPVTQQIPDAGVPQSLRCQ